jgi:hypothetical protein
MRIYVILFFILILFISVPLVSREIDFQLLDLQNVSRYTEDRIAFQHIELTDKQFERIPNMDSSVASLLMIKDKKMYLIKDGYDNLNEIQVQKNLLEIEDKIVGDLSLNKISGKPNYARITERRVELLKKIDMSGVEDFVGRNFGKFYLNVRNAFLEKHVSIFRQMLISRKESSLFVERVRLPRKLVLGGGDEKFRFATYVIAKTDDEKIYYAEDADADGVTETFAVHIGDGFHWGYKSGPNIIFIYNNKQEDIRKIIGNLANDASSGTKEEEEVIKADMDDQFRKSLHGRSAQGKAWDDTENVQRWLLDLIYESDIDKKKK